MITAAITGVGGGVGQSIIKALSLSELNIRTIALDMEPWSAGFYRCHKAYLVPPAGSTHYIDTVADICSKESCDILFPGSDDELLPLANGRHKIEEAGCKVVVSSPDCIQICRDKLRTFLFFHEKTLPFVFTAELRETVSLPPEFKYPAVIKPRDGSSSIGVKVVFSERELLDTEYKEGYIVQEYLVPGSWRKKRSEVTKDDVMIKGMLRQTEEISIQFLVGCNRQILDCFTSINTLRHGVPVYVRPLKDSPAESIARSMVVALAEEGLMGPCNLQCKATQDGTIFFEINPRFTGITAVRAALGWDGPDAIIRHFILDEDSESVRKHLDYDETFLCSRYVSEIIFPAEEHQHLQEYGNITGSGRAISL
jgi:carbamoylphosphate synthase large subunit